MCAPHSVSVSALAGASLLILPTFAVLVTGRPTNLRRKTWVLRTALIAGLVLTILSFMLWG